MDGCSRQDPAYRPAKGSPRNVRGLSIGKKGRHSATGPCTPGVLTGYGPQLWEPVGSTGPARRPPPAGGVHGRRCPVGKAPRERGARPPVAFLGMTVTVDPHVAVT